ncbi:MAG: AAA family ATPase [Burkholderiales bacterium]|nr:AAA family ATPase [Burkholderiales bacterium]
MLPNKNAAPGWHQEAAEVSTTRDILPHFAAAMQSAGITPPGEIIPDGRLHRFSSNGERGDDAGWYVLHADGIPAGAFGDWRSGISGGWRADLGRRLTPAEEAEARRRIEKAKAEAEAERQRRAKRAAALAAAIWKAASPASPDHPYLKRKGVAPTVTLRALHATEFTRHAGYAPQARGETLEGVLLIAPVKGHEHNPATLELIDEQGRKAALAGGIKAVGYWATGPLPSSGRAVLAEGIATALSIAAALGEPVAAALSVGNLKAAAETIRANHPGVQIVVAADLGEEGRPHPEAVKAAQALRCPLAAPPADLGKGGDFNDLHARDGLEAVRACIEAAAPPVGPAVSEAAMLRDVILTRASDIEPEPITWLWHGWLAAGKMHILAGAPGTGKTTIALSLAATITSGGRWPDGTRAEPGNVTIWSGEDDPADTLIPRLALMGADLSRVFFVGDVLEGGERRAFDPAHDIEPLRRKLADVGNVRLLIVDPIVSAVAGDSHRNAETRRGLQPLADLARAARCALLGITHFTKGTAGREPVERLNGSIAFGALARIVMVAAKRKEEGEDGRTVRVLCRAKANNGPDDGGFEYGLQQAELKTHPGIFASGVLWGNAIEGAARELLAEAEADPDNEGGTLEEAKRFLADLLADGPLPVKAIKTDADGAGFSWATIRRAQKALGVEARKEGGAFGGKGAVWKWYLPQGAQDATRCSTQNVEHLVEGMSILCEAPPQGAQDATRCSTKKGEHLVEGLSILCEDPEAGDLDEGEAEV